MVGDRHQPSGADLGAQRAGRVGQHEDLGAGGGQRAHRGDARRRVAALVEVRAAHEHAHGHAAAGGRAPRGRRGRARSGAGSRAARRSRRLTASSTASATAPSPEPSTMPTRGATCARRTAAAAPSALTPATPRRRPAAAARPWSWSARAAGAPEVHGRVGRGELLQALAAAAARRADVELLGHHGDGADRALAGGHHRPDGRCLRALALRVGGVLDVGARRGSPPSGERRAAPTGNSEYGA